MFKNWACLIWYNYFVYVAFSSLSIRIEPFQSDQKILNGSCHPSKPSTSESTLKSLVQQFSSLVYNGSNVPNSPRSLWRIGMKTQHIGTWNVSSMLHMSTLSVHEEIAWCSLDILGFYESSGLITDTSSMKSTKFFAYEMNGKVIKAWPKSQAW